MLRRSKCFVMTAVAGVVLMIASGAHAFAAGKKGAAATTLDVLNVVSLGSKQLKPGTYEVTADDTKVKFALDGKVVAEAAAQWKDGGAKSKYSTILASDGKIKEIRFAGKDRYLEITE